MIDRLGDCTNEMYKLFIMFIRPVNGHMTIDDYKAREHVRKLVIQPASQSISQSVSQPVSQSSSQSVIHSASQ